MKRHSKKKPDKALAILGLILNIIVLPGLGSIVGGRIKTGIYQMLLLLLSIPLMFIIIGIPLALGTWIWSIVTGIEMIRASQ